MGNKITSTRVYVDEKYTRPQGLYDPTDADYRKLRRLILNGQLAPCFPGVEECAFELDECPICFLFYPSLNRSRCCSKAICTECYLQIKSVHFARSTQCPFCKTSGYTVEFRGARTAEEKGVEQAEEQKVIEAKIRMRQKELRDEAERVLRLETDTQAEPFEHEINLMSMEPDMSPQADHVQRSLSGLSRSDSLDLGMEDWMLMEAIWLSIQEQGQMHQEFDLARHISPTSGMSETGFLGSGGSDQVRTRIAGRAGGLTRAMADHAERQGTGGDNRAGDRVVDSSRNLLQSDTNLNVNCTDMPSFECSDLAARCCTIDASHRGMGANRDLQKEKQDVPWEKPQNGERSRQDARCDTAERNGWLNSVWSSVRREGGGYTSDLGFEQSSTGAMEAGTSFSSSRPSAAEPPWEAPDFRSSQSSDAAGETSLSSASGSMSFEDQITLAMALSLADAQAQARKAWYEQLN